MCTLHLNANGMEMESLVFFKGLNYDLGSIPVLSLPLSLTAYKVLHFSGAKFPISERGVIIPPMFD